MKFLKAEKGLYGYLNKQRVIEIVKTVFMFACAIGLYLIGFVTLKTNKSIWTILAVLSILPASKSAVNMIMFFRFSSLDKSDFDLISTSNLKIPVRYEYVFTTNEKAYFVKSAACCDNTVIALLDISKGGKKKNSLAAELTAHIKAAIEREGFEGYSLKVYTDINDYCRRLKEMNENLDGENDKSSIRLFALFDAITL